MVYGSGEKDGVMLSRWWYPYSDNPRVQMPVSTAEQATDNRAHFNCWIVSQVMAGEVSRGENMSVLGPTQSRISPSIIFFEYVICLLIYDSG